MKRMAKSDRISGRNERTTMFKSITKAILTAIGIGFLTSYVNMFIDVDRLKAGEGHVLETVREIHTEVREIKWFLIKNNGAKIEQRGK